MNSSFMLVKSNIKKTKAQTVAIFVLIMITSLLINLCLMVALDYQDAYDVMHEELNEADVTLMIAGLDGEMERFDGDYLDGNSDVLFYESTPVSMLEGSVPYGKDNYKAAFFAIGKTKADAKTVGKYRFEQQTDGSGVFLPYQFFVSGNYAVGDRFVVENNGENIVDTVVRGFYSCTMTSTAAARICGFILTDDLYATVDTTQELPFGKLTCELVSIRLKSGVNSATFEYSATSELAKEYSGLKLIESNNTELVKSSEYSTQIIAVAVLAVAGLIFAVVSVVLISSNIAFFIRTNMKNFGMLKAIGYQSRKLRRTILAEFTVVSMIAVLFGTALSYGIFPPLNTLMESITGILYPMHFMVKPLVVAVAVIMSLVLATAWISTRTIKRLPPISAIRNVNMGKRQERNVLPVETTRLPVNFNLALKTMFLNWKQSVIVFITVLGISLGSVFCILMYHNVVLSQEPIIKMTNQYAHSFVQIDKSRDEALKELLDGDERVENYYMYAHRSKVVADGTVMLSIVADDCTKIDNEVMVYKGVMPKKDDEVAIGALYAENHNVKLGDTITVSLGEQSAEYKITAFVQIVGNSGNDIVFAVGGYEKLATLDKYDYLITLYDDDEIQSFNADVVQSFSDAHVEDYKKYLEGTTADFIKLMRFIIIGIIFICVSLMAFVLYVLVKTILIKKQREYSIMKSIGYSTKTLIAQTAISFLPTVAVSLAVSLTLATLTINDIFSFFIHDLGMLKTVFRFPVSWVVLAGVGVVALSFTFVCVFSLKIRKYSPRQLLAGN